MTLSGIFIQNSSVDHLNIEPVIVALYEQLDNRQREQYAFGALLRHRELLGNERYKSWLIA